MGADTMHNAMPWHVGRVNTNPAVVDTLLRKMRSNVAGDILLMLASTSGCLESFWASIRRSFDTYHIQHAAARLRRSSEVGFEPCVDHLCWLSGRGYNREEIRQIRYVVEVFYGLEPIFAILAALAGKWLFGSYCDEPPTYACACCRPHVISPFYPGNIEFLDDKDDLLRVNYAAVSHDMPVHSFYRALALWPEYAAKACGEIMHMDCFAERVMFLRHEAEMLAESIPIVPTSYPAWADSNEMSSSIHKCREMSVEVSIIAAALRKRFIMGEESERKGRENDGAH